MCLLTILHQCTEAVQCKHSLLVILTENKKFNLRFDSRQSRTGHPQSKILATPMRLKRLWYSARDSMTPRTENSVRMSTALIADTIVMYEHKRRVWHVMQFSQHPHLNHHISSDIDSAVSHTYSKFDASLSIVSTELCGRFALFYGAQIETWENLSFRPANP